MANKSKKRTQNPLNKVLDWSVWEIILHLAFALLFIGVIYIFVVHPTDRTLTNWLLLLVSLGIAVQIHQNINIQKRML